MTTLSFILLSCLISVAETAPTTRPEQSEAQLKRRADFEFVRDQMEQYGYLRGNPSLHEFTKALEFFQEVLDVDVTGEVDEATVAAASRPRCVHEDVRWHTKRSKRFSLSKLAKWDKSHFSGKDELTLKWYISTYTEDIDKNLVRNVVKKAFALWSSQSNIKSQKKVTLKFIEAASKEDSDINILWAKGAHGDDYDFDGENGKLDAENRNVNVLAHTFFPGYDFPLNGDIHFDDAETWDTDVAAENSGKRFFPYVLAHEIGHALGLSHSKKMDALMYPYYKSVPLEEVSLDIDDKCGINWNYGGSSEYCMFVWLMSEIVEHHNGSNLRTNDHGIQSSTAYRNPAKRLLKSMKIPKCTSNNWGLKSVIMEKLVKSLQFPATEVKKYAIVVCNFLAGLHVYRATPGYQENEPLEKEFAGVQQEVSTFTGSGAHGNVRRMLRHAEQLRDENKPSPFDADYFDEKYFDEFFSLYLPQ